MASQYDSIGSKYSSFKQLSTSIMEEENLKKAITPYLSRKPHGARVLDLASGTGHYSQRAIDWGARYVLGVDSSRAMVDAAKHLLSGDDRYAERVEFQVGDALDLGRIEGQEPFDVVLGAWLLNYAADLDEMTRMFRTVAANLSDDGVFAGLVPSGAEDVDVLAGQWRTTSLGLPPEFPLKVDYYERLASGDGWKTEISNVSGGERISFRNFHLRKGIYEEAARRAGLEGKLDWPALEVPERVREDLEQEGWKTYVEGGKHMGIVVVEKRRGSPV